MDAQSRIYNDNTILEYIYTIVPAKGDAYKQSVFINISTGAIVDPKSLKLTLDFNSEDKFKGVCCNELIEVECEGWATAGAACWVTENGLSWGF